MGQANIDKAFFRMGMCLRAYTIGFWDIPMAPLILPFRQPLRFSGTQSQGSEVHDNAE
jgi:hypothetical protein